MWYTSKGDRTLTGCEANLFRYGIGSLHVHLVECRGDWPVGVPAFDKLLFNQKMALLHGVARALLLKHEPPLRFTALNEATIAAVYEELHDEIEDEIEFQDGIELRQAMVAVLRWSNGKFKEDVTVPDAACDDMDVWRRMTNFCMDLVLWDRDFELEHLLDAAPESAAAERAFLGIHDDYFTVIPPDPTERQVQRYAEELQRLLTMKRRRARR